MRKIRKIGHYLLKVNVWGLFYQKRSAAKTPSFRAEIIARRNSVFNQVFSAGQYIDG